MEDVMTIEWVEVMNEREHIIMYPKGASALTTDAPRIYISIKTGKINLWFIVHDKSEYSWEYRTYKTLGRAKRACIQKYVEWRMS